MTSLYDELSEKYNRKKGSGSRTGPGADIGLLLFANRKALHGLWVAADRYCRVQDAETLTALHDAVIKLNQLFGERHGAEANKE